MGFALLTILPTPASPPPTELDAASLLNNETAYSSPPISSNALQNQPRETTSSVPSSLQEGELPIQQLEDPLSEIWNTPSEGSLLEESVDLNELMEEQRRLSEQLSELLSQIKERLEQQKQAQGEGGLTQAERQALMALLPQIAQSEIQDALESLLEETDPEALEDYLEQAQNLTRGWAPSPEGSEDEEPSPTEQAGEGQQEETQTAWEMMDQKEGEDTSEEQNTAPTNRQPRSSESEEEDWKLGEDDRTGGTTSGESEEERLPPENLPGFERQELAGSIGSQGEFQDFITKGVPLEPGPRDEEVDAPLLVNYETMRAILEERAIPADAREAIKKYFQLITQGET